MQQIQFCREGLHSYMTMLCDQIPCYTSYDVAVLEWMEIPHLMSYEIRVVDEVSYIYYKLRYRTSLKQVLGDIRLGLETVRHIVESIVEVLYQSENYLLNVDYILWRTDTTFIDINSGKLLFCYYPVQGEEYATLKMFLTEIMQYIDKKDEDTYMLMMQFYNVVTNPDCSVDALTKWIQYENDRDFEEPVWDVKEVNIESDTEIKTEDMYKEARKKKVDAMKDGKKRNSFVGVVILTVVNLVIMLLLLLDIWTYQYVWVLIVTLILLVVSILNANPFGESEEVDKIMEAYMQEEGQCPSDPQELQDALSFPVLDNSMGQAYTEKDLLETTVLTVTQEDIVVEDIPRELHLKSLAPKSYPDIFIKKSSLVIGSMKKNCDCVVQEKGISRMHAKILKKEDGLYVLDMNSTNQTFLNEQALVGGKEYLLSEGDVLSIAGIVNYVLVEEEMN